MVGGGGGSTAKPESLPGQVKVSYPGLKYFNT